MLKKKKICFVASSGGHWEEILCLREIADEHESFFVTEKSGRSDECNLSDVYLLSQINRREKLFIFHFLWIFIRAMQILFKEKPDVVITTGALVSYPFCLVAKLMRKKVVYIESFARVNEKSLTGKLVYPFADLFIVQWESMLKCYPNAVYGGGIF